MFYGLVPIGPAGHSGVQTLPVTTQLPTYYRAFSPYPIGRCAPCHLVSRLADEGLHSSSQQPVLSQPNTCFIPGSYAGHFLQLEGPSGAAHVSNDTWESLLLLALSVARMVPARIYCCSTFTAAVLRPALLLLCSPAAAPGGRQPAPLLAPVPLLAALDGGLGCRLGQ